MWKPDKPWEMKRLPRVSLFVMCVWGVGGGKGVSETNTAATVKYKWQREQKPAPAPWSVTSFTDHNPDIN